MPFFLQKNPAFYCLNLKQQLTFANGQDCAKIFLQDVEITQVF
jgi:hypothetical protein